MFSLRVVTGVDAATFELKEGLNIIGRLNTCDVVINSMGVSKKHAQITVVKSQCLLTDLGSSNGTFVNGLRIKEKVIKPGDRIAFHNVIVELTDLKKDLGADIPASTSFGNPPSANLTRLIGGNIDGQLAVDLHKNYSHAPTPADPHSPHHPQKAPQNLTELAQSYVENVVLPGIYKINEAYPLKGIIAGFILVFAVVVTSLSTVPMSSMMKDATQKEAQRRALTIARQLADSAERALNMAAETSIRTDFAENEEGVTAALVVAKEDGHIIAPLYKAQSYTNDEFVARARRFDDTYVDQIGATSIGASVPIKVFSAEAGQQLVTAYAIVLYKMNTLDWGATVGLFARVLIISLLIGLIIYFFIYKSLTHPIKVASGQLDSALRGETNILESKYDFDVLTSLISNINSAVARMGNPAEIQNKIETDYTLLATNFTRILNDAAITLDPLGRVICVNSHFEDLTGMRLLTLQGQGLDSFQDQALKLNLEDLFQKAAQIPTQIASSKLDISGFNYDIDAQAFHDGEKLNFVLLTIKKGVVG